MALSQSDREWVGAIVHEAVSRALLEHYEKCPQLSKIDTLFTKTAENAKAINGVAASVERCATKIEAKDAGDEARRSWLKVGLLIGVVVGSAVGSAGATELIKALKTLF